MKPELPSGPARDAKRSPDAGRPARRPKIRRSRRDAERTSATLLAAVFALLLWCAFSSVPAEAELSRAGTVDPDTGFPSWLEDTGGLRLEPCLTFGRCTIPRPDARRPPSTPDNIGEGIVYWSARAEMPTNDGGSASLELSTRGGFAPSTRPQDGAQQVSNRIRIRVDNLEPGATYEVTHPYGTETFTDVEGGPRGIYFTEDVGCLQAPCGDFETALNGRIGPWLVWDAPGAKTGGPPAGYVGDPSEPHPVSGSPITDENGNPQNYFKIEGPNVGGPGVDVVKTNLFAVEGKVSGLTAFADPQGGLHEGARTVTLTASDPRAEIFYTTDGTEPTEESIPYDDPLLISETTTLKFVAALPANSADDGRLSPVLTENYTIEN